MIKLKTILKEGKVWERKFGEPLPTLDSVMKKHQENKLNDGGLQLYHHVKRNIQLLLLLVPGNTQMIYIIH